MLKVSMLFNGLTGTSASQVNVRTAFGFSETWYWDGTEAAAEAAAMTLVRARVNILAANVQLYGIRIGDPTSGKSYIRYPGSYPGGPATNGNANLPIDAALCYVTAGAPTVKKNFFFHCLPDTWVESGNLLTEHRTAVRTVLNALNGWCFMAYSRAQQPIPIMSISAAGVMTLEENVTWPRGTIVILNKVKDIYGRSIRGNWRVSVGAANTNSVTLANWPNREVVNKGKARRYLQVPVQVNAQSVRDVVGARGRKCGRPFGSPRGRSPARA